MVLGFGERVYFVKRKLGTSSATIMADMVLRVSRLILPFLLSM